LRITRNINGISRLAVLILFVVSFLLGGMLSYIWTMGFYSPYEFNLPTNTNVTIEDVQFSVGNATYFNVTVLNPSYSPSKATIQEIKTETPDGLSHSISSTDPPLPQVLEAGQSQTFESNWNWGNYTNQEIKVLVFIDEGSGATCETVAAFMNLTVANVIFEPSITITRFNITVETMNSPVKVDLNRISVNGIDVSVSPPQVLPLTINPNESITFTLDRSWIDLQNKTVTVRVDALQGYTAVKTVLAPPPVSLIIQNVVFDNTTSTQHFNATVLSEEFSPAAVNITHVTILVRNETVTVTNITKIPSGLLQPNSSMLLMVFWDWIEYQSTATNVAINVHTEQDFTATKEVEIP